MSQTTGKRRVDSSQSLWIDGRGGIVIEVDHAGSVGKWDERRTEAGKLRRGDRLGSHFGRSCF